jgi:hypothetical protein
LSVIGNARNQNPPRANIFIFRANSYKNEEIKHREMAAGHVGRLQPPQEKESRYTA